MGSITETTSVTTADHGSLKLAPVNVIDYAKIRSKDPTAVEQLLKACQSSGLFFLDLRNDESGKEILSYVPSIYKASDEYFEAPEEKKMKDYRADQPSSQDRGYKKSDADETFEMSFNEFVQGDLQLPSPLSKQTTPLKKFNRLCHTACLDLLSTLSAALSLSPSTSFENHHLESDTSDSGLKLIYEPSIAKAANVGENKHCDSGTLTFLFYEQLGMHAYMKDMDEWAFTAVQPGCALVNVANSLQRMSDGKLHSTLHRVTQPEDGAAKRYFLSYFLRPSHETQKKWEEES